MRCPVDGAEMTRARRSGVEVDRCPECRGVWLDQGEMEKIVAMAVPRGAPDEALAPGRTDGDQVGGEEVSGDRRNYGDKLDEWLAEDEAADRERRSRSLIADVFEA